MFSCEFCEISKNSFFYRAPPDKENTLNVKHTSTMTIFFYTERIRALKPHASNLIFITFNFFFILRTFQTNVTFHVELSQLICSANQINSFDRNCNTAQMGQKIEDTLVNLHFAKGY